MKEIEKYHMLSMGNFVKKTSRTEVEKGIQSHIPTHLTSTLIIICSRTDTPGKLMPTVRWPKLQQNAYFHLLLGMSHQNKFQELYGIFVAWPPFLCLQRKFRKIQRKICHRTIFALISHTKVESTYFLQQITT